MLVERVCDGLGLPKPVRDQVGAYAGSYKVGVSYVVYGLASLRGTLMFLLCDDADYDCPYWCPAACFTVIDPALPENWILDRDREGFQLVPPEWLSEPDFHLRVLDGYDDTVEKWKKIKVVIDEEQESRMAPIYPLKATRDDDLLVLHDQEELEAVLADFDPDSEEDLRRVQVRDKYDRPIRAKVMDYNLIEFDFAE